ncbi:MAG: glycosyltransferase, partial [Bryobacterales bacterium]|nr:glycosyltransferase [Bryobacterales bacterium]
VRLYGEIPYSAVPEYMAQFRIGLIPFHVNELTLATNPIKLFEYFSCGLPVVSSALPEVAAYRDHVYLSHTPAEFAAQVTAALTEDSTERRRWRHDIALGASWENRATDLLAQASAAE